MSDEFRGAGFLVRRVGTVKVTAPEVLTDVQRSLFETAQRFANEEVLTRAERIEKKDLGLLRELLRLAGKEGLLGVDVAEAHGGTNLDTTTSLAVSDAMSALGSWSATFGAHTTLGTLPISWFGTEAQKQKYLPRFTSGDAVAAWAVSESAGSDAYGVKATAKKSTDGRHFLLSGTKQYITNAGFADSFIVFANLDAELSAFVVERNTQGLTVGPEERKLSPRGLSTCPLMFDEALVPLENLLGEWGQGQAIVEAIANLSRLRQGVGQLAAMKLQLEAAVTWCLERKHAGKPLVEFDLTKEKLARMAEAIFAVESMAYRTAGHIDGWRASGKTLQAALDEFTVEVSMLKVFASEAAALVVDDALQLHGTAGTLEEYSLERGFRDARVARISEGTVEHNRLRIPVVLARRAMAMGGVPVFEESRAVLPVGDVPAEHLKRLTRLCLKVAVEAHGPAFEEHQLVLAALADLIIDCFALDSMTCRVRQRPTGASAWENATLDAWAHAAHTRAQALAHQVLCASARPDALPGIVDAVAQLEVQSNANPEHANDVIAQAVVSARGYPG